MFEKSSLRTRLSFYLAIKQLGGSTLTLRPDELHLSKGGESIEDTAFILKDGLFTLKHYLKKLAYTKIRIQILVDYLVSCGVHVD